MKTGDVHWVEKTVGFIFGEGNKAAVESDGVSIGAACLDGVDQVRDGRKCQWKGEPILGPVFNFRKELERNSIQRNINNLTGVRFLIW